MARAADLRRDYDQLGEKLLEAKGSAAAAIVRERRLIGELLDALEAPEEVSVVDQLAARRRTASGAARPTKGRRKSG